MATNKKFLVESARITDAYMQMIKESSDKCESEDGDGVTFSDVLLRPVDTFMRSKLGKKIVDKVNRDHQEKMKKTVSETEDINPVTGLPYNDSDDAGEPDSVEDWDKPEEVDENEESVDVPDENGDAPLYMGDDDVDANCNNCDDCKKDDVDECDVVGNIDANESIQADPNDNIFVVILTKKGDWLIESAWGYREDAKDRISELMEDGLAKSDAKILSKRGLKSLGLDNENDSCWVVGDVSTQFNRKK